MTTTIRIIKNCQTIRVISPRPTAFRVQPFSFTATIGQTEFTLPVAPASGGLFLVSINGTPQDQEGGDFSVSGLTLTFAEPLDTNDKVYGFYEKQ